MQQCVILYIAGLPTTQTPGKIWPADVNIQTFSFLGFAPRHGLPQAKMYLIVHANSEGSVEPAHSHNFTRTSFSCHTNIAYEIRTQ